MATREGGPAFSKSAADSGGELGQGSPPSGHDARQPRGRKASNVPVRRGGVTLRPQPENSREILRQNPQRRGVFSPRESQLVSYDGPIREGTSVLRSEF